MNIKDSSEEDIRKAYYKGMDYLTKRRRTAYEVKEYLKRKGFSSNSIEEAINKLIEYRFLDDSSYVDDYIKDNLQEKGKGKVRIVKELLLKGVLSDLIEERLQKVSEDIEISNGVILTKRYLLKNLSKPFNQNKIKVVNKLKILGYSWDTLNEIMNIIEMDAEIKDAYYELDEHYVELAYKEALDYFKRNEKKDVHIYNLKMKITKRLNNKGFDWDTIRKAIDKLP